MLPNLIDPAAIRRRSAEPGGFADGWQGLRLLTVGRLMGVKTAVITMVTVLENLKEVLKGQERTDAEDLLCRAALEGIWRYAQTRRGK